jgi:hypothetical protein
MSDISFTMEAKSDQLNAVDIMGAERIIRIREVRVQKGDQPISVFFDGDNNRPWKPSKGMIRILAGAWGTESDQWVGKYAQLYFEPSVKYAGKEVGGIRIRALSDIDKRGLTFVITLNRQQREPYPVAYLDASRPQYPEDRFAAGFDKMVAAMKAGKMTLQQVISQCQKTGDLTEDQIMRLEAVAPVEVSDHEDEEVM